VKDPSGSAERTRLVPDLRSADRVDSEDTDTRVESGATSPSADLIGRGTVGAYSQDGTAIGGACDEPTQRVLVAAEVVDEHDVVAVTFNRCLQPPWVQPVDVEARTDRDLYRQTHLSLTLAPQPARR
jgi:hypothetical protein